MNDTQVLGIMAAIIAASDPKITAESARLRAQVLLRNKWTWNTGHTIGKDNVVRCAFCGAAIKSHLLPSGQCVFFDCDCQKQPTATEIELRRGLHEAESRERSASTALAEATSKLLDLHAKYQAALEKLDASIKRRGELEDEVASLRKSTDLAPKCLWCDEPMLPAPFSRITTGKHFLCRSCGATFTPKNK